MWRHVEHPVSFVAMAGGTHYVEALFAILCTSRVQRVYAMGWCGSLRRDVNVGDVVVAYAAVRGEAASREYVHDGVPAVAEHMEAVRLYEFLRGELRGVNVHLSVVYTTQSHLREGMLVERYGSIALCVECEVSLLYILSQLTGLRSVAVLIVSDSLVEAKRGGREVHETSRRVLEALTRYAVEGLGQPPPRHSH